MDTHHEVRRTLSRRQLLRSAAYASAGVALLGACTTGPGPGLNGGRRSSKNSLTYALFSEPTTLNPITQLADVSATLVIFNLFDSLVAYDIANNKLVPGLATSWRQVDPKTWEFTLRQGVMFHKDFGELTADDVVFNVNYTVEQNKPRKFLYFYVVGAKAIDKYTVQISLSQTYTPFLFTVAQGAATFIVSKKAFDQLGEQNLNRSPVGTGPFEFDSWVSGSQINLKRNAKYFKDGLPILDKLVFRPVVDPFVKQQLIKTGEIDMYDFPNYRDVAEIRKDAGLVVSSVKGWNWDYINFNFDPKLPVFKEEVRQAISYAIDREEIVRSVYYGEAQADDGPMPEGYLGAEPRRHMYPMTADVAKAKSLLAQAGYANGFTIECMTAEKGSLRRELELVAAQLDKAGIKVQIQNLDTGTYNTRWGKREFQMALKDVTMMTPDSDSTMYWFLHSNTVGWKGHNDPQLDQLLDQARTEQNESKRAQLYQQIVQIALKAAPYIWTNHHNAVRIWRKGLQGYVPSHMDIDVRFESAYWTS
jgi:peptide/nickel transport system substrate-binding protein